MSSDYREDGVPAGSRDFHRALASLQEELEAVDYYQQRADVCEDGELKDLLIHNRDEEIEHSAMLIEWLRRREPAFDEELRTYLFTSKPVTSIEENEDADGSARTGDDNSAGDLGLAGLNK